MLSRLVHLQLIINRLPNTANMNQLSKGFIDRNQTLKQSQIGACKIDTRKRLAASHRGYAVVRLSPVIKAVGFARIRVGHEHQMHY